MSDDAHLVAYAVILAWVMVMTASAIRTRGRLFLAVGNRDNLTTASPLSGRADRAAANMLENLLLFLAAYVAAKSAGAAPEKIERGAQVFLAARALYFPVYLIGVKVLRTALWGVAIVGVGMLIVAALSA
jgi:uncharacterized MAPEG superfamily protein